MVVVAFGLEESVIFSQYIQIPCVNHLSIHKFQYFCQL